ncbi:MAG: hypothetical protein RMZ41_009240 [Nostoc sp. DedVER02]|uniref:hypothetical protein n=1 Tax=unclassified Nostoc TaxID=2593658 RepID=UPI002AD20809|nr:MULTISPECIES: hypothetical protein [unclassified Nostoc]MDZ7990482.1 hypothetical protein [Nostoc sp. DedVER02]MDZ8115826.1 hypothetical protein [Nostoc sp. DedVER01b]
MQNFDERAKQGKPSCFADPEGAIWLVRGVRRAFLYDEKIGSDNSHTDTFRNSGAYIYSIMSTSLAREFCVVASYRAEVSRGRYRWLNIT